MITLRELTNSITIQSPTKISVFKDYEMVNEMAFEDGINWERMENSGYFDLEVAYIYQYGNYLCIEVIQKEEE